MIGRCLQFSDKVVPESHAGLGKIEGIIPIPVAQNLKLPFSCVEHSVRPVGFEAPTAQMGLPFGPLVPKIAVLRSVTKVCANPQLWMRVDECVNVFPFYAEYVECHDPVRDMIAVDKKRKDIVYVVLPHPFFDIGYTRVDIANAFQVSSCAFNLFHKLLPANY